MGGGTFGVVYCPIMRQQQDRKPKVKKERYRATPAISEEHQLVLDLERIIDASQEQMMQAWRQYGRKKQKNSKA